MQTALLVDAHYQPLAIINWQKAILLLLQQKAEVIKESSYYVRSVSRTFNVPRVLRLFRKGYQMYRPSFSKRAIFLRDKGSCAFCNEKLTLKNFTVDHLIPLSRGGQNTWLNVVTAC